MKPQHVRQLGVFYQPRFDARRRIGRLALARDDVLFQFDAEFLASGLELSPFKLPLKASVQKSPREPFDGLFGLFDDSLPDGWGRMLIDRRAAELGFSSSELTPLDRLALVGARSMGALVYEPETEVGDPTAVQLDELAAETERVIDGKKHADLVQLMAIGGSPQGARPKALIQIDPRGDIRFGARDLREGHTAWLVKFPAKGDEKHAASLEVAYCDMAREAGIDVPRAQVLGRTKKSPGYFAIERFDRAPGKRVHVHTLGGLLHLPHGYKAFDYLDLLGVTRELTRDESAVLQMFRRACFNVVARNRDDHCRNFAFTMSERGEWSPSPAYDLTYMEGPGGEHSTLVDGEGREPTVEHLARLAGKAGIKRGKAKEALERVRAAVDQFDTFASVASVPAALRKRVAKALGVPTASRAALSSSSRTRSRSARRRP